MIGSANLMTVPSVSDSLAGRMDVIKLLPLSRSEIPGSRSTFLDNAFNGDQPKVETTLLRRLDHRLEHQFRNRFQRTKKLSGNMLTDPHIPPAVRP